MEISKDHSIFTIIDKHSSLIEEDCECLIKFTNSLDWNEKEYENFINVMKSEKYDEYIDKQILEIYSNEFLLNIVGNSNIIKYCKYNKTKDTKWFKNKIISKDIVEDILDSNLNFYSLKKTETVSANMPANWNDIRKYYKLSKRIYYTDPETKIKYIVNITKNNGKDYDEASDIDMYYNLKSSGILSSSQKYEFYVDITNTDKDNILPALIKMEQSLNLSTFVISKSQQTEIIKKYYELIKNDVFIKSFNNKNPNKPPLITPKPVTLEKINLLDPNEYGSVSILSEYTVTEKADGERLLMFIDDTGRAYLINNTYKVVDTGLQAVKDLHNSLIDGEFISCNSRKDNSAKGLYATFDIYYYGGKKITSLPLIDNDPKVETRYKYMQNTAKMFKFTDYSMDYIVKEHLYSKNILNDSNLILSGNKVYPYDIDGLIFTPAKLALYSYYANKPVQITDNVKWDRVFKWKPPEQNTIDFLAKEGRTTTIDGIKYKEFNLYVGYNASQWEPYTIDEALKIAYNKEYRLMVQDKKKTYIPKLFQPNIYYKKGIEKLLVKIDSNGKTKCENGENIEGDVIIECIYDLNDNIPPFMRWKPMRLREDKIRIYKSGELSKTANDMSVAINIWRSIHNPVTESIIRGTAPVKSMDVNDSESERLLETDDIYYSRNIPRDAMFSYNMLQFHNLGIKRMLYSKPPVKNNLIELACGEGGDMSRWIDNGYKFILGIDLVKNNIYGPRTGAYSRMLENRKRFFRNLQVKDKVSFPNMVFVAGDCGKNIIDGECSLSINDQESFNVLQNVLNKKRSNMQKHYSNIVGQGSNGFDVCSCMFSIHYFFKSEETLDTYLNNVSSLLKRDGTFFCTFMDGKRIEDEINSNGGDTIEGVKNTEVGLNKVPIWAIIRRYNVDSVDKYNKKIDVFIESTNKFIPEYLVSYDLLVEKCKNYNLELVESELFSEYFNKLKSEIPDDDDEKTSLHKIIIELDKDPVQKKFSFFNRWCIFKKI